MVQKMFRKTNAFSTINNVVYDAFVCYSSQDQAWVHEQLWMTLEEKYELTLCIHERDFMPGIDIQDNIVQCLEESRNTILVLSESFVESRWCQWEARLARNKLLDSPHFRDNLIMVLLDDVNILKPKMNDTLRSLLDMKTYLQYPTNKERQPLFWLRLNNAIIDQKKAHI